MKYILYFFMAILEVVWWVFEGAVMLVVNVISAVLYILLLIWPYLLVAFFALYVVGMATKAHAAEVGQYCYLKNDVVYVSHVARKDWYSVIVARTGERLNVEQSRLKYCHRPM